MIPIQHRLKAPTAIQDALYQFGCEIRVSMPAIVVSYDPGSADRGPTVSVQPAIKEVLNNAAVPTITSLPILDDVPVQFPGGGGWMLTFPIEAGDEVLLVFSDMGIDQWWQNGGEQKQPDGVKFRHDIGDAIAIPALRSNARGLDDLSTSSAQLRSDDGLVVIDLSAAGVTITAPLTKIISSGGAANPLTTSLFFDWFVTNVMPYLAAHGYTGPTPPAGSVTSVLEGE